MSKNKLIIAAAGAGKTTFLVKEALKQSGEVLITTYTEANEAEIKKKIIKLNRAIPANITIQTWFSFLIQHGMKPYQGHLIEGNINGMLLVNQQSGFRFRNQQGVPVYFSEGKNFEQHYFTKNRKIYSDKLSKFVIRSNEKSGGNVIDRISRIYPHIFVDEVQDLAGYDLEILKLFFQSNSSVVLVGDPRQVTYLTHHDKLHSGYKDGKIEQFILNECKKLPCEIDKTTLKYSHRNNAEVCNFSSRLFPEYPASEPCICKDCRQPKSEHNGIFIIKPEKMSEYINLYSPIILRYQGATEFEWNFGKAKGLGFERVLIHPTEPIINYLRNGALTKTVKKKVSDAFARPKFYVALTRAVHSVGIILDYNENETFIDGINKY